MHKITKQLFVYFLNKLRENHYDTNLFKYGFDSTTNVTAEDRNYIARGIYTLVKLDRLPEAKAIMRLVFAMLTQDQVIDIYMNSGFVGGYIKGARDVSAMSDMTITYSSIGSEVLHDDLFVAAPDDLHIPFVENNLLNPNN